MVIRIAKMKVGCGIGNDDIGGAGSGDGEYRNPGDYQWCFHEFLG